MSPRLALTDPCLFPLLFGPTRMEGARVLLPPGLSGTATTLCALSASAPCAFLKDAEKDE